MQIDTNKPSHTGKGTRTPSRKAITFLMVTAFLNAMGIGILGPVLPFIVQRYTGNPNTLATVIGCLAWAARSGYCSSAELSMG